MLSAGDRPYVVALVGLLVLVAMMAIGPLQSFTAAAERVDTLTEQRDRLSAEVSALSERERRLQDPAELELLARQELGLVRPGEIPFVVVPPDDDVERVGPDRRRRPPPELPWYERLGRAIAELFA